MQELFDLELFLLAALDTTASEEETIDPIMLEADEHGYTDPRFIRGETCYQFIVKNDFEVS